MVLTSPSDFTASLPASFATFFLLILIFVIAAYLYFGFALMTIAKKTNIQNGWLAFIPIGNYYLMTQVAKVPWWTLFGFFLAFIPLLGIFIFIGLWTWLWWKISEARGKPGWLSLLMLIPLVNLIIVGIIAWKD